MLLPFLLLYWADMWRHTMFFDEVNAWAISAASPTLGRLFHYVHYEGHPWLWYFILWFPSRLTHDPVAMKWVEAAIGTAILLLVGLLSPFSYRQRALILAGYFFLWEYTVMCRMYSVMLLLVLLYVVRRVRKPEGVLGSCALLGLAANTDLTGVLLASALLVEYVFSSCLLVPRRERRAALRRWIPSLALYAALVALSIASLWPAKDISWQSSGRLGAQALNRHRIDASIGNMIAAPWWPISPQFPHRFWGTSVVDARWLYLLVPLVLFVYWTAFRRDRNLLLLMFCTLLFGIAFADIVYPGRPRHWGIAFISFLVGLWFQAARAAPETQPQNTQAADHAHPTHAAPVARTPRWSPWTWALLALSALAGVTAVASSWYRPFSRAREAAQWLQRNQPGQPVTGMPDVSFASLAEEMQQRVYFPECNCFDTFKLFSRQREDLPESAVPSAVNRTLDTLGRDQILFTYFHPFDATELERFRSAGLAVQPVASFLGADMLTENFVIYRIRRVRQPAGALPASSGGAGRRLR